MSNLHRDLDEFNLHNPKGFNPATPNTFATKSEQGSSYYEERMQLPKVINIVDGNLPAPSTADLDAFIIIDGGGGVLDLSWGPSSFNDWVRFNGGVPYRISPLAGYLAYNENGSQWKEFDGSNWVDFGGGVVNTLYTADGTLAGARTVGTGGNTLSFVAANGTQTVEPVEIITGGNTSPFDAFLIKKPNGFRLFDVDGDGLGIMTQAVQDVSLTIDSFGGSAQSDALLVRSSSSTTFFRSVNSGKVAIGETISTILNSGSVAGAAVLNVGGKGSTSGTTALLVQNSLSANLLEVKDDGGVNIGTQTAAVDALLTVATKNNNGIAAIFKDSSSNLVKILNEGGFNSGKGRLDIYDNGVVKVKLNPSGESFIKGTILVGDLPNGATASRLTVDTITSTGISATFKDSSSNLVRILNEGGFNSGRGRLDIYDNNVITYKFVSDADSYINTGANFGIGITTPTAKLHVKGDFKINSSLTDSNPLFTLQQNGSHVPEFLMTNSLNGVDYVKIFPSATSYMQVPTLGIGFTSLESLDIDSTARMHVNGDLRIDSPLTKNNPLFSLKQNGSHVPEFLMKNSLSGVDYVKIFPSDTSYMSVPTLGIGFDSLSVGNINTSSKLHVKGSGSTSGTTALLVQNSLSSNLLEVKDDGSTTLTSDTPLSLYRTANTNGFGVSSFYDLNNSIGTKTTYLAVGGGIDSNIAGAEDGYFAVYLKTAGVLGFSDLRLNKTGLSIGNNITPTQKLHVDGSTYIKNDLYANLNNFSYVGGNLSIANGTTQLNNGTSGNPLTLFRDANTNNFGLSTFYDLKNSSGAQISYVAVGGGIDNNTAANESGFFSVTLRKDGAAIGGNSDLKLTKTGLAIGAGLTPTAKLQVKGLGSTSATTALLVQNSLSSNLLEVQDDGKTGINASSPLWALHVKGINGDANIAEFQTWQGVPIMAVVDTGVAVNSATMLGGDATTKLSVSGKIYCNNDIQGTKFYAGAEIAGVTANFEGGTTASLRINGNFHQDSGPSGYGYFKNLSVGTGAAPTSKLQVKGSGSTSGTSALLVQNSLSANLLEVKDDGTHFIGKDSVPVNNLTLHVKSPSGHTRTLNVNGALLGANSTALDITSISSSGTNNGISVSASNTSGTGLVKGVSSSASLTGGNIKYGVLGSALNATTIMAGVRGEVLTGGSVTPSGTVAGVMARNDASLGVNLYGLYSESNPTSANSTVYGVWSKTNNQGTGTTNSIGGYFEAIGGTNNYSIQVNGLPRIDNQTATGATAGADTLPANPVGFITINLDGTNYKVPYYNV